jgi:peptidoglycan-N-acetylmuramic acid deacetylase
MSDTRIALTFDAEHPNRPLCPPGNAERILDTLAEAGAKSTFFVQGSWAGAYPLTAARIAAEGHLVGNHSHYHVRMPLLSDHGIEVDVMSAEESVRAATGAPVRPWFRCPFGAGADDDRILSALRRLGYVNVSWHVALEDWEPWRRPDDIAADAVSGALSHGDGAVVLLHTWPGPTADALPAILEGLVRAGAQLIRVDELEQTP